MSPTISMPTPSLPALPPPPVAAATPATAKPRQKNMTPTFLGADATPIGTFGAKTLLGQ